MRSGDLPVYGMYGMRIASEPALPIDPLPGGAADVVCVWGPSLPVPSAAPEGRIIAEMVGPPSYTITAVDAGHVVRFHGACDMVVSADLAHIECRPDPGLDRELVPVLLVGTVAAFLLAAAGRLVLHGSVVGSDALTFGFVGRSGAGKSTVAALCCAAGASLVSDDVLAVDSGPHPVVVGGWPELRLRPPAGGVLELFSDRVVRRDTVDGRVALRPPADTRRRRLDALIVPRPDRDPSHELTVTQLSPRDAMLVVSAAGRIEGWQNPPDRRFQFEEAARLVEAVPVFVAHVPWTALFTLNTARALLARLVDEVTPDTGQN